ncbi:glutamate racemase [Enterococcus timonensis]|uniref:glutamate racemase n=1 Tax=Enterococcus timonensis TaxID=1852364 RepID=UPI0008DB30EB|nr:glutamate racemase [Enterococcus timonensis]
MQRPIGFMDSGVGGLTVVKEAMKQLPHEEIIYIGDTARCPYGPRPKEEIIQYTLEMADFLVQKDIKMLVIACNTATSVALEIVREKLTIPVIGVILPGARAAVKATKNKNIAVIGTLGTIKSDAYAHTLHVKDSRLSVTSLACPDFVDVVEHDQAQTPRAEKVVSETLAVLPKNIDTLILGCTHYPILRTLIQNAVGPAVTLIDSGAETVSEVSALLDDYGIGELSRDKTRHHQFFTTGSEKLFAEIAENWLEVSQLSVAHVDLETEENHAL